MLGAYNFRPISARGRRAPARVFRSGQLFLSTPGARRTMARLGISLVVDLRSPVTATAFPDRPIPGARRVNIDVIGADDVTGLVGVDLMRGRYRQMVVNPGQRERLGQVLRLAAQELDAGGAVLVHCTDGKDRTGWVAALLQHLAGDEAASVEEAYLGSARAIRWMVAVRFLVDLVRRGHRQARVRRAVNVVHADYLGSALAAVQEQWGSLDRYLSDGLGLEPAHRETLRRAVGG